MFRITIARALVLFGLLCMAGLSAVIGTNLYGISRVKIGGPLYDQIKLGNDLIADVLPPPLYVIEAYLEATLALHDSPPIETRRRRLVELKEEYGKRLQFWSQSRLDPGLKETLTFRSNAEVERFWDIVGTRFLPALESGSRLSADQAYGQLTLAYDAHRKVIDGIVQRANAENAATELKAADEAEALTRLIWGVAWVVLLALGGGVLGCLFAIVRPIGYMTKTMEQVAAGDLDAEVPGLRRHDELGAMARALNVFKDGQLRVRALEIERSEASLRSEVERREAIERVADAFDRTIVSIAETVENASCHIETAAVNLTSSVEETQHLSAAVATSSAQSSANAQAAAAASEQMASSVAEISRQVQEAHKIAREAVAQAENTNAKISHLSNSADRIGQVVRLIGSVAEQTNLLALNATIEAARAGEAGRGFAVVASEVKTLAAQTAKATDEIALQVEEMQAATRYSVLAIHQIGGTISQISVISNAIATAVEQQSAASQEISRNVHETAGGASQVADNITRVSCAAAEAGAAANQVNDLSIALKGESRRLGVAVGDFLAHVRT